MEIEARDFKYNAYSYFQLVCLEECASSIKVHLMMVLLWKFENRNCFK